MSDIHELDCVALKEDLPEESLPAGLIGTVVYVHGSGEAVMVEFCDSDGSTYSMPSITPEKLLRLKVVRDGQIKDYGGAD